jgi:hypothetical protein
MTGGNVTAMRAAMDPATHVTKRARLTDEVRALRAVLEKELEANVRDTATTFGWRYTHFRPAMTRNGFRTPMSGDTGYPDCTMVKSPWLVIAELKRETEEPRPDQVEWLDRLALTGAAVYLFKPRDWASGEIEDVLRNGPSQSHVSRWVA